MIKRTLAIHKFFLGEFFTLLRGIVHYLIGTLTSDIAALIVREPEETQECKKLKEMFLLRFKFTGDKFWQLFIQYKKDPNKTWRDYFFDISWYFGGWLEEFDIHDFEKLKQLTIVDQIKKKILP